MQSRQYQEATAAKSSDEPKAKGWRTPFGFGDFTEPVTYAEACEGMKELSKKFFKPNLEKEDENGI